VPVVSTTHADIPYALADPVAALLAPEGDAEALAHALETLLADPERWKELGEAGRLQVAARHDVRTQVPLLEEKYHALLA